MASAYRFRTTGSSAGDASWAALTSSSSNSSPDPTGASLSMRSMFPSPTRPHNPGVLQKQVEDGSGLVPVLGLGVLQVGVEDLEALGEGRSEERRVGKECRCRW